jgi:micrococcal nuclease
VRAGSDGGILDVMSQRPAKAKLSARDRRWRYVLKRLAGLAVVLAVGGALVLADGAGLFGRRPPTEREKYHGKSFTVGRVIDGDTLDVEVSDGPHAATRVRLWGVDTPELARDGQSAAHFGPEASAFTRRLCLGQQVRLELEAGAAPRGGYGRLLAWAWLPDGRLLNRVLVEEGCGYADPRYDHHLKGEFARLQREAMDAGRGLWADVEAEDLPRYYRGRLKLPER